MYLVSGEGVGFHLQYFSMKLVLSPGKAHYQVGAAGRQVGIVKTAFQSMFPLPINEWAKQEVMSIICAPRNITPLCNSKLSPLSAVTGRNDLTERIAQPIPPQNSETGESEPWDRLKLIYDARALLLKLDSRRLLQLAMSKNLRSGVVTNGQYTHDQNISVWLPALKNGTEGFVSCTRAGETLSLKEVADC